MLAGSLFAGPYAPIPGQPESTAIPGDDPLIAGWANSWQSYIPGEEVNEIFQTPGKATGPSQPPSGGSPYDIVSLGRGGSIILEFSPPIKDLEGADLAVFENSISNGFLELGFVEVSSNGIDFVRFPNDSLTSSEQGPFTTVMDATEIDGLAGKYRLGYGTPFDLTDLPDSPALDKNRIRYVRIIDIVGDGNTSDSSGDPIYDPFPTVGSAGFDLDAVGALHVASPRETALSPPFILANGSLQLRWQGDYWLEYVIEASSNLENWTEIKTVAGIDGDNFFEIQLEGANNRFFRIRTISPE